MISLLGSLLGFGSSLIGPVLEAWNKNSDQKHELARRILPGLVRRREMERELFEAD